VAAVFLPDAPRGDLLLVVPGAGLAVALDLVLQPEGTFERVFAADVAAVAGAAGHSVAAAQTSLTLRGGLRDGVLFGEIAALDVQFRVPALAPTGASAVAAGYYRGQVLGTDPGEIHLVVGPQNQMVVVASSGGVAFGGVTTLAADGSHTLTAAVAGGQGTLRGMISPGDATVSGTIRLPGRPEVAFVGAGATAVRTERLINLSSLARAGTGARTLITGFVITGQEARPVLVRAIGPSLAAFGVREALANPQLRLYRGDELIAENDDWSTGGAAAALAATFARVGAFPLAPGSVDAALALTLTPGNYTLHLSDATGEGSALAEIYDAGAEAAPGAPRLANLSIRSDVGAGGQVLVGGFVIAGKTAQRVLVRAVGPGLVRFGVAGALAEARLAVYGPEGLIAENEHWVGSEVAAAAQASGAFALDEGSKDAALVLTLRPGAYTARVTGGGGAAGVALLEVYEVP
jgi:hypothetical protein